MYVWGTLDFSNDGDRRPEADCPIVPYPVRVPNLPFAGVPVSLACGVKHAVFVAEGTLYGFGSNASSQLGPSVFQQANLVTKLTAFHKTCDSTPVQVACGSKHTLVRTVDGQVWSEGDNTFGQLGHKATKHWSRVPFTEPVEFVAAGGEMSFAISAGRVFSWGSIRSGALGLGTKGEVEMMTSGAQQYRDVDKPRMVQWFTGQRIHIVEVSVGKEHMICRSDVDVYCVGQGNFGKLGQGDTAEHLIPKRVQFPERKYIEKLLQVVAGHDHSSVLKQSSEFGSVIYIWGRIDADADGNLSPKLITEAGSNVTSIYASKFYNMAISSDGTLQVWGKCNGCPPMGVAEGVRKRLPCEITVLTNKKICKAIGSSCFMIAFGDDSKLPPGEPFDVVVPFDYRNPTYPYDEAAKLFYRRALGEPEAAAYWAQIPIPPPKQEKGVRYKKMGARTLHTGSHVRVWMTDVYALGRVLRRDIDGFSKTQFEIAWAREDWDPEIVELHSDDETLDEANENRWQHLWFLELPDGCLNNVEKRVEKAKQAVSASALVDEE
jgi:alpha-tubulin suppressor-like RCC1 family protein